MRPEPRRQNPTSFLRKWPRAKRRLRGPNEYIKVFIANTTNPREAALEHRKQVYKELREGYNYERVNARIDAFDNKTYLKMRFYRAN